jgi:DNA-binding ferritin-like protein
MEIDDVADHMAERLRGGGFQPLAAMSQKS